MHVREAYIMSCMLPDTQPTCDAAALNCCSCWLICCCTSGQFGARLPSVWCWKSGDSCMALHELPSSGVGGLRYHMLFTSYLAVLRKQHQLIAAMPKLKQASVPLQLVYSSYAVVQCLRDATKVAEGSSYQWTPHTVNSNRHNNARSRCCPGLPGTKKAQKRRRHGGAYQHCLSVLSVVVGVPWSSACAKDTTTTRCAA